MLIVFLELHTTNDICLFVCVYFVSLSRYCIKKDGRAPDFAWEASVTRRLWQVSGEELNNAAPPWDVGFLGNCCGSYQHQGYLWIQSCTAHAAPPPALGPFPVPLTSSGCTICVPFSFPAIVCLCHFIAIHPQGGLWEQTHETFSIIWICKASLIKERHGNIICGNKIPLVRKFRILKSTLQNQACVCYLTTHEPEIQTWTPPNVVEFKRLTSQIRSFYATLMQGGPVLCLSEYLNLPTSIPKHEQSNTHN